jgi:hypothetical protein
MASTDVGQKAKSAPKKKLSNVAYLAGIIELKLIVSRLKKVNFQTTNRRDYKLSRWETKELSIHVLAAARPKLELVQKKI